MSDAVEANLALARRAYEVWNEGDVDAMVEHVWPPDVIFQEAPEFPGTGVFRGAEAVAAHMRDLLEAAPDFQLKVLALEGRGDYVFVVLAGSAAGAASGVALTWPMFHVIRYHAGRMRECRSYLDADHARRDYERLAGPPIDRVRHADQTDRLSLRRSPRQAQASAVGMIESRQSRARPARARSQPARPAVACSPKREPG